MKKKIFPFILVVISALITASCAEQDKESAKSEKVTKVKASHRFPFKIGEHVTELQLAITNNEQRRGLMFVRKMEPNHGMLFVYTRPQKQSFFMKNTYIPLDIGFFDTEGILKEYYPMYPHDETPIPSHSKRIQFALEMNQGWFQKNKIKIGTKINLKTIKDALIQRGFDPEKFGFQEDE